MSILCDFLIHLFYTQLPMFIFCPVKHVLHQLTGAGTQMYANAALGPLSVQRSVAMTVAAGGRREEGACHDVVNKQPPDQVRSHA